MKYLEAFLANASEQPSRVPALPEMHGVSNPQNPQKGSRGASEAFEGTQGEAFGKQGGRCIPLHGERYDAAAARARIAAALPRLAPGQRWRDVPHHRAIVEIVSLEPIEGMPWPLAHYRRLDGGTDADPRVGAPAFLFGRLLEGGS